MSCGCQTSPESDTPDTLSAQLTALINTLFGGSTITVVGDRPVFASCFSEVELTNAGGVLCALKEAFESATGATTDSVQMVQYSCLPVELTPPAQTVSNTLTLRDDAGGSSDLYFTSNPQAAGVEINDLVSGDGITPGTRVTGFLSEEVESVVTVVGVTLDLPSTALTPDPVTFSRLAPAPCSLGDWICWVSNKLVGLEAWKTETRASLDSYVLERVGYATASMGTSIYNLQVGQAALAASNASLQSQVAGLQTAYNALLARVNQHDIDLGLKASSTAVDSLVAQVSTLSGQVSTLTTQVVSKLGVPTYYKSPLIYWTSGAAGVGAAKLLGNGTWQTLDVRKNYDNTNTGVPSGVGTGIPKYALLGVTTLAAQGDIKISFSKTSDPDTSLFNPVITYGYGSHSAGAKVTTPVLVPLTCAGESLPATFQYKIAPGTSAHYESEISLMAVFF